MKKISVLMMSATAAILIAVSCNQLSQLGISTGVSLKSSIDSVSYAIGVNYGAGLGKALKTLPGGTANLNAVIAGFADAIKNDSSSLKFDEEAAANYVNQYVMGEQTREAETTKAEGEAFLAANTKEGVITTESGLQYKVLNEGTGIKPTVDDQVKVHYTGKLLDGTVFDSSVERGEPFTSRLTGVIQGWQEVLQIMPAGSKYQVWIPSNLAYGQQSVGQIKPNSVLEFEIELLEVIKGGNQ
ncbi:MAG: FKBP-type peptidyl-prolyl cis-trans isomerase [Tannerella sp.]|jgi:FKBP-type peptidyl-prolyl cis-trans isomerase|nr:FKBP-type peptidyl-prolyl cis-trans isomerase [Tannerella sp.]